MKRNELNLYKDKIIDLYLNKKLSCQSIAEIIGARTSGIYDALKRWNIDVRNLSDSHKIYTLNENYFNNIDTEDKAYWLGFIYADGFLVEPNSIGIALKNTDKSHLKKFINALDSDYAINDYEKIDSYGYSKYSRVLIRSKNIYNQLMNKGVFLRKSLILKYPSKDILPTKFNRDFIRGYFDGDGTIVLSTNSINFKICGTKELLGEIIRVFNYEISNEFAQKLYKRRQDDKNNYYISYGGKYKTLKVMRYLYENSNVYLDRKHDRYLNLIDICN